MPAQISHFLVEGQQESLSRLVNIIKGGDALAFVGSGISKDADYPTWTELVEKLALSSGLALDVEDIDPEGTRLIDIVEECKGRLQDRYYDEIRRIFDPATKRPFSLMHLQILQMPFVSFPTTNIDNCHLNARAKLMPCNVDNEYDINPDLQLHQIRNRRIFYLHGKIEDGDRIRSIVLSRSEYENVYGRNTGARAFLLYALIMFDCVFIGYSMNDPFMNNVIKEARNILQEQKKELEEQGRKPKKQPNHFAVLPRQVSLQGSVRSRSEANKPVSEGEIQRLEFNHRKRDDELREWRITPIYYRVISNHNALLNLIDTLHTLLVMNTEQVPVEVPQQ